jgi:uncharacterized membrane protein
MMRPLARPSQGEATLHALAQLYADHDRQSSRVERAIDRATAMLGSPVFLTVLTLLICLWVAANLLLPLFGQLPLDALPFPWLGSLLGLIALYVAILILATKRRADQLAARRDELTLELGILSEKKSAKIIELLEELRHDSPNIKDRIDHEAAAMATPADPRAVLDAIKDTHTDLMAAQCVAP